MKQMKQDDQQHERYGWQHSDPGVLPRKSVGAGVGSSAALATTIPATSGGRGFLWHNPSQHDVSAWTHQVLRRRGGTHTPARWYSSTTSLLKVLSNENPASNASMWVMKQFMTCGEATRHQLAQRHAVTPFPSHFSPPRAHPRCLDPALIPPPRPMCSVLHLWVACGGPAMEMELV